MNDQDALQAIAAVDRLKLEAARAAQALADLETLMLARGASKMAIGKVLGLPQPVRHWCSDQARILEAGTEQQQATFRGLEPGARFGA